MRISDWSSDVCSSDLADAQAAGDTAQPGRMLAGDPIAHLAHHVVLRGRGSVEQPHPAELAEAGGGRRGGGGRPGVDCPPVGELEGGRGDGCQHRQPEEAVGGTAEARSEEHTSELQSLMRISYAVFCLKKKTTTTQSPASR